MLLSVSVGGREGEGRKEALTSFLRIEWLKLMEALACVSVLCPPQAIDLFE